MVPENCGLRFSPAYTLFGSPARIPTKEDKNDYASVLAQNFLVRKELPKASNSLTCAISHKIYFSTVYADQIQNLCIFKLKELFAQNKLPQRLQFLIKNLSSVKDYSANPCLPGFDKITLELCSILFQKQIVIYTVSEDHYLNAIIINSHFTDTIELLKSTGGHFDPVYNQDNLAIMEVCSESLMKIKDTIENDLADHFSANPPRPVYQRLRGKSKSYDMLNFDDFSDTTLKTPEAGWMDDTYEAFKPRRGPDSVNWDVFLQSDEDMGLPRKGKGQASNFLNAQMYSAGHPSTVGQPYDNAFMAFNKSRRGVLNFDEPNPLLPPPKSNYLWAPLDNSFRPPVLDPYEESMLLDKGSPEKRKPIILAESKERYIGQLKFFDESKNYGFIVMDQDGSDIFVHYDDLSKASITKDYMRTAKQGNIIRMTFSCMSYIGKYNKSRKAVDIQLLFDY